MQEPIIAHSPEASGENMAQDQPQEVRSGKGPGAGFSGAGFHVSEGHLAVSIGKYSANCSGSRRSGQQSNQAEIRRTARE